MGPISQNARLFKGPGQNLLEAVGSPGDVFLERCYTHICTCYSVSKYLHIYICTYIYIILMLLCVDVYFVFRIPTSINLQNIIICKSTFLHDPPFNKCACFSSSPMCFIIFVQCDSSIWQFQWIIIVFPERLLFGSIITLW